MENNMDTYVCNKSLKKLFGMINIKFRVVLGEERGMWLERIFRAQIPTSPFNYLLYTFRQIS